MYLPVCFIEELSIFLMQLVYVALIFSSYIFRFAIAVSLGHVEADFPYIR